MKKKDLHLQQRGDGKEDGGGVGWGAGMRPKKAYISKTNEPNLKNENVLESAWTGASTWR